MKAVPMGFEFRAKDHSRRRLRGLRGLRYLMELVRMDREYTAFEAQLREFQRIANTSRADLQALADRVREIGGDS